jgi:hypothetical protein
LQLGLWSLARFGFRFAMSGKEANKYARNYHLVKPASPGNQATAPGQPGAPINCERREKDGSETKTTQNNYGGDAGAPSQD